MKLILSRKGFDSGYGGIPSPILPDGRLVPLPIPSPSDRTTLADLNIPEVDLQALLLHLSGGVHTLQTAIHLDPDLDRKPSARLPGWRPALGQTGNAQSHLQAASIGAGDIFLFFGWFREVECTASTWRYVKTAPDLHVIFGWLEVAEVLAVVQQRDRCLSRFPWIANHAHVADPDNYFDPRNTLYVGEKCSRLSSRAAFGGGRFPKYDERLRLTKPGSTRSIWRLPPWFLPREGRRPLSYHPRADQWQRSDGWATLRSAAKGQEFILHGDDYPEAEGWAADLIRNCI